MVAYRDSVQKNRVLGRDADVDTLNCLQLVKWQCHIEIFPQFPTHFQ